MHCFLWQPVDGNQLMVDGCKCGKSEDLNSFYGLPCKISYCPMSSIEREVWSTIQFALYAAMDKRLIAWARHIFCQGLQDKIPRPTAFCIFVILGLQYFDAQVVGMSTIMQVKYQNVAAMQRRGRIVTIIMDFGTAMPQNIRIIIVIRKHVCNGRYPQHGVCKRGK
ncbi:hypothetical protein CXB51_025048 [Gossypium anomalum]|uniref:Uncharacterized protein n=1 Tax=Gossypium anomalum TaxID=47600 RepID=A0A8J5YGT6_9ROSI|nr:hypothetical protein CXB51_025048 [Gossypium anomalum]